MIEFKPPRTEYRELWKPIADTNEMYWVSDKGRVFSKRRNKILSPVTDTGYARVRIANKICMVHRLVMEAFKPIENCDELTVNHIDLDKLNNCITNLEWCSQRENVIHFYKNGEFDKKGERSGASAKLTEELVKQIRNEYAIERRTATDIGKQYGVRYVSITRILTNKTWYDESYIPIYKTQHNPNKSKKGSSNPSSKLTENDVLEIRKMFGANPNVTITDISRKYEVSRATISNIVSRKKWTHI